MIRKPSKKRVMLPRGYLSWSAYNTFRRNREEYIRHYFYGEPTNRTSPSIEFGQSFAKHLESRREKKRVEHGDPIVELALQAVPIKPQSEYHIKGILPSKYGDIPLIGTLDQYDPKTHAFDEFKTGWRKWTQATAQSHGQMKFYALILWLNYNVIQQPKNLIWVETERSDGGVRPTGRIIKFPVDITLPQLLKFSRDVIDAAHEISELYQETITKTLS